MTADLREQLQQTLGSAFTLGRELGGGGMSRVFVAREEALGRDVAVKVLPPDAAAVVSSDRFKREIRLAARLQHPHIVPLLSAERSGELLYYMMPFVEGESLRARLAREGELPIGETVSILREVARALAYAHEHGVVHRDIKPDNVMLSGEAATVTDFGVGKALVAAASNGVRDGAHDGGAGHATAAVTQLGVAIGTPAYMAPEQAAADPSLDHRADIYSFGCMAYEMLTGAPPFTGRSPSSLLAAHVSESPEPVANRRPSVPPRLSALVMQCLEKHPADRPRNARELLRVLDTVETPSGSTAQTRASGLLPRRRRARVLVDRLRAALPWAIAAIALGALALHTAARDDGSGPAPVRFSIAPLADEGPLLAEPDPAVSPDGRYIVYRASIGSGSRLDIRRVADFTSAPIPGSEGATHPFFSPDGKWIAFFSGGRLMKARVEGGPATAVARVPTPMGASWAPNGDIVMGGPPGVRGAGLMRITAAGGAPAPLTRPDAASGESHVAPLVLPDGRSVLFLSAGGSGGPDADVLAVASLDDGTFTRLGLPGVRPIGLVDDHLVYSRSDAMIMAVPFDARRRRLRGEPVPLGIQVGDFALATALSREGTLVYAHGGTASRLVWVDARGIAQPLLDEARHYEFPRLSPDGTRLAVAIRGAQTTDVWLCDLATGALSRFTTEGGINDRPEWTPDGRRLVFRSTRDGTSAIWWQPVDGSEPAERLTPGSSAWEGVVSPDGRTLLYRETEPGRSSYRLMHLPLAGPRTPRPFLQAPGNLQMPRFSPDGRWVAYQSDASGRFEVYVRSFPSGESRARISTDGGTEPLWSADGRRLHYRKGTRLVTATMSPAGPTTVVARDSFLLDPSAHPQSRTHQKYDVARDGRVVMPRWVGEGPKLGVVLHWDEELRAAVSRP